MTRLERYEGRTSGALTVLALCFLLVYAAPILDPGLPGAVATVVRVLGALIWLTFAVDLVVRVALADRRVHFLAHHPLDVATVVLPVLRPLRVLRVFTAAQTLLVRPGGLLRRGEAIGAAAALFVVVGSLAELSAERGAPGADIETFGEALWWAVTTVTTVGYGDYAPVTATGRVIAVALMVTGISLVGVITATVAAWFVSQSRPVPTAAPTASPAVSPAPPPNGAGIADPGALGDRVAELTAAVARLTAAVAAAGPPGQVGPGRQPSGSVPPGTGAAGS